MKDGLKELQNIRLYQNVKSIEKNYWFKQNILCNKNHIVILILQYKIWNNQLKFMLSNSIKESYDQHNRVGIMGFVFIKNLKMMSKTITQL